MRRVVITGLGALSPHGLGAPAFWSALLEGKSSLAPLAHFDSSAFPARVAGAIPPFKTTDYVPKSYRKATKIMARDIELAVVAADFAVRDGKLATKEVLESSGEKVLAEGFSKPNAARVGCNIGAGLICADLNELTAAMAQARNPDGSFSLSRWGKSEDPGKTSGMDNLTPLWLLKYLPNMLACHVSILHDTEGPSNTITCGQASAGLALAEACRTIQRGNADLALVGGCESKIHPMGLMRWSLLQRLNTTSNDAPQAACRPLDQAAAGTVLAEGGAVLVIEALEHAQQRNATIYAEVVGFGSSANGGEVIDPDPSGEAPAVAMRKALQDAQIGPEAVQLVIPSGYGVRSWDKVDAAALRQAFGAALGSIAVAPARGGVGDCGAGAQALDLVAAAMALREQTLFPVVNCPNPIDGLAVPQVRKGANLTHAVVVTSALGGQNSAIVLKRYS